MYARGRFTEKKEEQKEYNILNDSNISTELMDFIQSEQRKAIIKKGHIKQMLVNKDPFSHFKETKVHYKKYTKKK